MLKGSFDVDLYFDLIPDMINIGVEAGMEALCLMTVSEAFSKAPYDTGRLRQSITYRIDNDGSRVDGVVGTNVEYAAAQEFGIPGKNRAQPYMGPALRAVRPKVYPVMATYIGRAMK